MAGVRELLAVVLGGLLGVALVAKPRAMVMLSVLVGPTRRRRHEDPAGGTTLPFDERWLWLVRAAGVACIAVAGYVAYTAYYA